VHIGLHQRLGDGLLVPEAVLAGIAERYVLAELRAADVRARLDPVLAGEILRRWLELFRGGLPEGATVQSWRGMEGGLAAVAAGRDAIMSPTSHCYFDYPLSATDLEEAVRAHVGSVTRAVEALSDVARVKAGQPATVRVNAYRNREFKGTVERVALARGTEQSFGSSAGGTGGGQGGWFKCEVKLDLTEGETLLSGLAANVDIVVATTQGLLIPSQSLLEKKLDDLPKDIAESPLVDKVRKKAIVVFRMVDGKAVLTPIKTGASNLTDTMAVEGLSEGDVVVTGPYRVLERLKQGDAIREETGQLDFPSKISAEAQAFLRRTLASKREERGSVRDLLADPYMQPQKSRATAA
jgi:hypothetical protein